MVESNPVPFEVLPDDSTPTRTGLELHVYSATDPTTVLDVIPTRRAPAFLEEVNRVGGGSFVVSENDPRIDKSVFAKRNIVKCKLNQQTIGAFVISGIEDTIVPTAGEAGGVETRYSGEGLRTWLNDATVRPYGGIKLKSPDSRVFSFASEQGSWYHEEDWVAPVEVAQYTIDPETDSPWGTAPAEWPDAEDAYWIWSTASSSPGVGYAYFRYEFDIDSGVGTKNYSLFASADDEFDFFVDAGQVLEGKELNAYAKTYRADFELDPGHHILAARVRVTGGRGGLIAAFYRAGDATADPPTAAELLKVTDDTGWLVNAYPVVPPGWTPGEVMLTLLAEASDRGIRMAEVLVPTFTATEDSEGVEWDRNLDWVFDIGSKYALVVEKLEELACDVWIDPSNYELNMAITQGNRRDEQTEAGQPVEFRIGKNIKKAASEAEVTVVNSLLQSTADGYVAHTDSETDSIEKYGVIEGFVSADSSLTFAGDVALAVFRKYADPEETATYEIIDVDEARPYVDFRPGDWVLAPNSEGEQVSRRVMSISVAEDAKTAQVIFALEFDTISENKAELLERWLQVTSDGTLGGSVSNSGGSGSATPAARKFQSGIGSEGASGGSGATGDVGMTWQNTWSSIVNYEVNDVVYYAGTSWIAVADNLNSAPTDASANWDRMVATATVSDADMAAVVADDTSDTREELENVFGGFRSAVPTSGAWLVGDKVWNTLPAPGDFIGWVCTTAGSPGTWKGFGLIDT